MTKIEILAEINKLPYKEIMELKFQLSELMERKYKTLSPYEKTQIDELMEVKA